MTTTIFDVCVVGGGVVGLSAALGMAKRGFAVAVLAADSLEATCDTADVRVFAVNMSSQQLLTSLGVWSLLPAERLSVYRHMSIWDANSSGKLEFDARLIARDKLGYIIEETVLRSALLQALKQCENVTLLPQHTVLDLQQNEDVVDIKCKEQNVRARFLMAADGANSPCRNGLQVPTTTRPYHHHALVATINTELPHEQTAYQIFNADGPLAFLPLSEPKQCSIVWSTTPTRAEALAAASELEFNEALEKAFASRLGKLSVCSRRYQFPLVMRHVQQYTGKNWVLLGDAAHTIHPLAGLGLNLGLADVADWFSILDKNPGRLPVQKELAFYQRQRKHAVWQVIVLMQSLKSVFASTLSPVQIIRGWGMQSCDKLPLLKRMLIDYANG